MTLPAIHSRRPVGYRYVPARTISLDKMLTTWDFEIGPGFNDPEPVMGNVLSSFDEETDLYSALTKRERVFADLLVAGYSRAEIAEQLGISVQAVHQRVLVMRTRITAHLAKRGDGAQ